MKNKYLFVFANEQFTIVETKLLDMPEGTTPDKVYFWLKLDNVFGQCDHLTFVSMQKEPIQIREFKEGVLKFDREKGIFNEIELKAVDTKDFSEHTHKFVVDFLSKKLDNKNKNKRPTP